MLTPAKTYVEKGYQPLPAGEGFMPKEMYQQANRKWVKACVDVVLYFKPDDGSPHKMAIAKRKIQPMMDWWFYGGKLFVTDESYQAGLVRKLKEEIGLEIDIWRISEEPLRLHMYKWAPDNSVVSAPCFHLEITPAEYQQMRVNLAQSPEYSDLDALELQLIAQEQGFHEALRDCAKSLREYLLDR